MNSQKAVQDTIGAYLKENQIDFSEIGLEDEELASIERFYIIGCGSAYHVAMAAKYVLEDMTQIPVEIDIASEFRYRNPILVKNSLVVIILSPERQQTVWQPASGKGKRSSGSGHCQCRWFKHCP